MRGHGAMLWAMGACPRIGDIELQLASFAKEPFSGDGWLFEIKYDGFRVLAGKEQREIRLRYRGGSDASRSFPDVAGAVGSLKHDAIVDGEMVVLDRRGR